MSLVLVSIYVHIVLVLYGAHIQCVAWHIVPTFMFWVTSHKMHYMQLTWLPACCHCTLNVFPSHVRCYLRLLTLSHLSCHTVHTTLSARWIMCYRSRTTLPRSPYLSRGISFPFFLWLPTFTLFLFYLGRATHSLPPYHPTGQDDVWMCDNEPREEGCSYTTLIVPTIYVCLRYTLRSQSPANINPDMHRVVTYKY